ncbi:hypothetical protein M758_N004000 [Ceratodon purpureus]|nr:hypothetical protein M758_N004000 [Ceratodon purpureus]
MVLKNFENQVVSTYKNPEEFMKWQIAGGRQDRQDTFIGVGTSTTPSADITAGVDHLVQGIFEAADGKGDHNEASNQFKGAVSGMVKGAFNVFLSNTEAGSSTQTKFLIIPHGYSIYRVDVCMYKYTFSSKGFTEHFESQTVVYTSRGLLDAKNLKPGELLSYVSEITGGDKKQMFDWMNNYYDLYSMANLLISGEPLPSSVRSIGATLEKKKRKPDELEYVNGRPLKALRSNGTQDQESAGTDLKQFQINGTLD